MKRPFVTGHVSMGSYNGEVAVTNGHFTPFIVEMPYTAAGRLTFKGRKAPKITC